MAATASTQRCARFRALFCFDLLVEQSALNVGFKAIARAILEPSKESPDISGKCRGLGQWICLRCAASERGSLTDRTGLQKKAAVVQGRRDHLVAPPVLPIRLTDRQRCRLVIFPVESFLAR